MNNLWDAFNMATNLKPKNMNDLFNKTNEEILKDNDLMSQISENAKKFAEKLYKMTQEDDQKKKDTGKSESASSKNSSNNDNPYKIFEEDKNEKGFFRRHYEKAKMIIKTFFDKKK